MSDIENKIAALTVSGLSIDKAKKKVKTTIVHLYKFFYFSVHYKILFLYFCRQQAYSNKEENNLKISQLKEYILKHDYAIFLFTRNMSQLLICLSHYFTQANTNNASAYTLCAIQPHFL